MDACRLMGTDCVLFKDACRFMGTDCVEEKIDV